LGNLSGSSGALTVTGAASSFTASTIVVGFNGTGSLNILDGGIVNALPVGSFIASSTNSAGSATVSGAGSTWNTAGLTIGSTNGGNASLTIGDGGTVNVNGTVNLNDPTGVANGTLTLNTGGTLNVTNGFSRRGILTFSGGTLNLSGGVFSNAAAPAVLTVSGAAAADLPTLRLSGTASTTNVSDLNVGGPNRGAVEVVGGADLVMLGAASLGLSGGSGSVLVDGVGSTWAAGGTLQLGVSGSGIGTMTISNGGAVTSVGGVLGVSSGTTGTVTATGTGTSWASSSKIIMGGGGSATLTIAEGASVNSQIDLGSSSPGVLNVRSGGSFTSSQLLVGIGGAGTMSVEGGGTVTTSATTFIANGLGTGTATVTGAGSSWTANAIQVGAASSGSGVLNVLAGGSVTTNVFTLNDPAGSATGTLAIDGGSVTVNGTFTKRGTLDFRDGTLTVNAGTFDNASPAAPLVINGSAAGKLPTLRLTGTSHVQGVSDLTVGQNRTGSLYIESRSELVAAGNAFMGLQTGGNGSVTVEGLLQTTGSFRVGGGVVSGGAGTLLVQYGGRVIVGTTLSLYPQGTVRLNNGRLSLIDFSPQGGTFDFASGSVTFSLGATLDSFDLDGLLGAAHTLRAGQALYSDADFTLGGNLKVDGGTLEAANDLIVSANTFLTLVQGNAKCQNNFTNQAGGVVSLEGGTLAADVDMANAGEIQLHGGTSLLLGPNNLTNSGLIWGNGQISAALNNQAAGVVRASGSDRLVVTAAASNAGLISLLNGGTVEFRSALTNSATGRITGRGVVDARGGVINNGQIAFSGELSDFFGAITNNSGGKIIVTGLGMATFYDEITHNAGAEIRVSAGSSAVFLGAVNGTGFFSGSGTKYFEGGGSAVGPVVTPGSTVVEAAASLSASFIRENSLTVNGLVTINSSGGTSHLNELNIASDGVLDLKNNSLVLEAGDLAVITDQIRSGLYEGVGITSSAPGSPFRLGSMSNSNGAGGATYSTFQGIGGLDGDEVLIRYTRIGDLNLDGTVTISDFIDLASHFNTVGGATWQMGDVNYDGVVSISDFIDLASNFNQSVSGQAIPISAQEQTMLADFAASNVPEPVSMGAVGVGALLVLARRKRR
ncbi:MAG TPA: PEP-CTERM sorting domain-containing protein, partial [Tepidisphaeraceae bacterium]|nr:PEP-CTERM sorting domain-containing protein [Tepidisphaeraceae bacterium]